MGVSIWSLLYAHVSNTHTHKVHANFCVWTNRFNRYNPSKNQGKNVTNSKSCKDPSRTVHRTIKAKSGICTKCSATANLRARTSKLWNPYLSDACKKSVWWQWRCFTLSKLGRCSIQNVNLSRLWLPTRNHFAHMWKKRHKSNQLLWWLGKFIHSLWKNVA